MKLAVVGTGYVGLVVGVCFAETGNDVICVDIDEAKIKSLSEGTCPIYEPGLEELLRRNLQEHRLSFTTDLEDAVKRSLIIFIAVGTPPGEDGSSDLRYVKKVAQGIGRAMNGYKIIVNKSTVPVGTADQVGEIVSKETKFKFDVVSNPEFLKEGTAIEDFMRPDRVVIGAEDVRTAEIMKELYGPVVRKAPSVLVMDTRSAEMTKYACNAMLAARISFMNELANLCEHVGADVELVRLGLASDERIGPSFLFPGVGYGGSCFPKDIKALIQVGEQYGYQLRVVKSIEEVNNLQKYVIVDKIVRFFSSEFAFQLDEVFQKPEVEEESPEVVEGIEGIRGFDYTYQLSIDSGKMPNLAFVEEGPRLLQADGPTSDSDGVLRGRKFAVWGLSFKPQTDDMREAPSKVVIGKLLELGAEVTAYDPEAMTQARHLFGDQISYAEHSYDALKDAEALILLTEWNAFRNPDFGRLKRLLRYPIIFDGRNQYNPQEMKELGFVYFGIGCR